MSVYKCYEPGFVGAYTMPEMIGLYNEIVNKSEYGAFQDWFFDMLKSGVFIKE